MKKNSGFMGKIGDANSNQYLVEPKSMIPSGEVLTKPFTYPSPIEDNEKYNMHERIAVRAYFIWQNNGSRPYANDFQNWREAEDLIFEEQKAQNVT